MIILITGIFAIILLFVFPKPALILVMCICFYVIGEEKRKERHNGACKTFH